MVECWRSIDLTALLKTPLFKTHLLKTQRFKTALMKIDLKDLDFEWDLIIKVNNYRIGSYLFIPIFFHHVYFRAFLIVIFFKGVFWIGTFLIGVFKMRLFLSILIGRLTQSKFSIPPNIIRGHYSFPFFSVIGLKYSVLLVHLLLFSH